jgi:hypothetical protein
MKEGFVISKPGIKEVNESKYKFDVSGVLINAKELKFDISENGSTQKIVDIIPYLTKFEGEEVNLSFVKKEIIEE